MKQRGRPWKIRLLFIKETMENEIIVAEQPGYDKEAHKSHKERPIMDYYENWSLFVSNIDVVPDELDGEKLIRMVSTLSRTRAERESLGRAAADGDKTSLQSFLNKQRINIPLVNGTWREYNRYLSKGAGAELPDSIRRRETMYGEN